jgi:hypothetical protein
MVHASIAIAARMNNNALDPMDQFKRTVTAVPRLRGLATRGGRQLPENPFVGRPVWDAR